jgi:hypothetical protein
MLNNANQQIKHWQGISKALHVQGFACSEQGLTVFQTSACSMKINHAKWH